MNEVVKYNNDMNTVALRKFNSIEMDIFMAICSRMRDKDEDIIEFRFDYIKKLIKNENNYTVEEFGNMMDNVYNKLLKTSIKIGDDRVWTRFVLFTKYTIDLNKCTVEIGINKEFKWVLNELTAKFTRFELEEYVEFKSSYTKEFFRRMQQFKSTGIWKISIVDFRKQLDIAKSYSPSDIDKRVLAPILKELKKEYKLKIKKIYKSSGVGRPKLEGYEFRFLKEEIKKEDTPKDNLENKKADKIKLYNKKLKKDEIYNILTSFMKADKIWLKLENTETKDIKYQSFESTIHYTNFILKYSI